MASTQAALPYTEPGIVTILILASFLLLLNVVNNVLDRVVYCGLVGQILIGVAWGVPGANWLSLGAQDTIMQLGYLGLILIVYEGGLSTNIASLKANLFLSATVALIGISAPIALSFTLQSLLNATPLQAFAAGAALCSTSLGTTFTVLTTSGLTDSRLGVVLTSAAMMDDVVGLVMVQVISNLGQTSSLDAITVVRPICVSLAFAFLLPLFCLWVVKPLTVLYHSPAYRMKAPRLREHFATTSAAFLSHTAVLLALVTGSSYAGTSNLFAAYLAGASVSWWDGVRIPLYAEQQQHAIPAEASQNSATPVSQFGQQPHMTVDVVAHHEQEFKQDAAVTGMAVYERYYAPAVQTILKPLFFASIGFSIPISKMFEGSIIWRGFVYAALMALGKLQCGLCLIRFAKPPFAQVTHGIVAQWPIRRSKTAASKPKKEMEQSAVSPVPQQTNGVKNELAARTAIGLAVQNTKTPHPAYTSRERSALPKPRSLYPASILGCAMMARGEIGFLISSVAESKGIYSDGHSSSSSELYIVVTWAILLCTVIGPVSVGLLVKRVRRLQGVERSSSAGREDPLGIWGVNLHSHEGVQARSDGVMAGSRDDSPAA